MTILTFIDTETTGLDPRIHQPYEAAWWHEDDVSPVSSWLRHDLTHADQKALEVGRYWDRNAFDAMEGGYLSVAHPRTVASCLEGVTLVGSNPAFDAAMLTRYIGSPVWHHRLINVADAAMWVFNWDRPKGLHEIVGELVKRGYDIPAPDHTAEADVRATRAVYYALKTERSNLT